MKHTTFARRLLSLCLLLALLVPMGALVACQNPGEDEVNVPVGMQNATGDGKGYYFFVPDGWQVDHSTGLTTVSAGLYSSVSLSLYITKSERTVEEYFADSREGLEARFADFTLDSEGEVCTVGGNAALRYAYHGKYYTEQEYKVMQYLTRKNGHIFVLTYTANPSEFDQYTEVVGMVAADFVFTNDDIRAAGAGNGDAGSYENAPEGMREISLEGIHEYSLFVPDAWRTDMQSGIVSAYVSETDRSNISLAHYYPPSGVNTIAEFFAALGTSYSSLYENFEVLHQHGEGDEPIAIGGREGALYLMRGTHGGVDYRVMQIFFVKSSNIYVFTYPATDAVFDTHKPTVDDIVAKITFP